MACKDSGPWDISGSGFVGLLRKSLKGHVFVLLICPALFLSHDAGGEQTMPDHSKPGCEGQ